MKCTSELVRGWQAEVFTALLHFPSQEQPRCMQQHQVLLSYVSSLSPQFLPMAQKSSLRGWEGCWSRRAGEHHACPASWQHPFWVTECMLAHLLCATAVQHHGQEGQSVAALLGPACWHHTLKGAPTAFEKISRAQGLQQQTGAWLAGPTWQKLPKSGGRGGGWSSGNGLHEPHPCFFHTLVHHGRWAKGQGRG